MDIEADLVVIGGGMAGLVSGTIAAEAGLDTVLIRKGQSATAYSSGAIDVMGYLPMASEPFSSPEEGLFALSRIYPLHPYCVIGYDESIEPEKILDIIVERTRETLDWLKVHLEGTMAPVIGDFDSNIHPITILGTTKPTCLIQKTMDSRDLHEREDSVLLFVGISGYADFNSSAAAQTYLEDIMASGSTPRKVAHCVLQVMPFGKPYNLSSIELARHLDHEGSVEAIVEQLKGHIEQVGATHIAFPPILGIRNAMKNKKKIEEMTGTTVFELLGFPPSIPGQRLQKSLETIFVKGGGKLLLGHEAISYTIDGQRLKSITAKSPRREIKIEAKAFLLATGKYIGGGIAGDENGLKETVFDLMPVTGDYHSAVDIVPSRSTNTLSISPMGQPIQSCGLSVDPKFRPVTEDGLEWAENLFAAGAILAGYNYAVEKSGLGVAATSGFNAAKNVIELIKEVV
ncbi:MAG: anaerobic glycerol-3-phosphate dehydrogenase subunit B [Candidatus Thorarchaeota archaeon]|nr:MAG: anaerobic glycerol-3-phosphate dehydrogenase subunit B [Candidatus Thorarchaeota archaeon]